MMSFDVEKVVKEEIGYETKTPDYCKNCKFSKNQSDGVYGNGKILVCTLVANALGTFEVDPHHRCQKFKFLER